MTFFALSKKFLISKSKSSQSLGLKVKSTLMLNSANYLFYSVFAIFALTLLMGYLKSAYPFIQVAINEEMKFGDLQVLLRMSDFYQKYPSGNVYEFDFSEFNVYPNYPTLLPRFLGFLDIGIAQLSIFGLIQGLILGFIISKLLTKVNNQKNSLTNFLIIFMFGIFFIISPPILLLIERGNFDQIVFVFSVISIYLYSKNYLKASFTIAVLLTLIKIYPIVLLVAFLIYNKFKKAYLVFLLIPVTFFTVNFDQIKIVSDRTPLPDFSWGFGLASIPAFFIENNPGPIKEFLVENLDVYVKLFLMGFTFLITHIGILIIYKKLFVKFNLKFIDRFEQIKSTKLAYEFFSIGSLLFVFIYVLGTSWDYRLVFLLIPITGYFMSVKKFEDLDFLFLMLFLSAFYFTFSASWLAVIGDLCLIIISYVFLHFHFARLLEIYSDSSAVRYFRTSKISIRAMINQ